MMIDFLFWSGIFIGLILFNPRDLIELFTTDGGNELHKEVPVLENDDFHTEQAH